ncbi:MAG: hypothetical protein AAB701_02885 [Patescibacteria group bacterium]
MKHRVFSLWLGIVVISSTVGLLVNAFLAKEYNAEATTFQAPIDVAKPSPFNPDELLVTAVNSNKTVWRWNIQTGERMHLVLPALAADATIWNIFPATSGLIIQVITDKSQYYFTSQVPNSVADWQLFDLDGSVLEVAGNTLVYVQPGDEKPTTLTKYDISRRQDAGTISLPELDSDEWPASYSEFTGEGGLVRFVITTRIWRQYNDESWFIVDSPPIPFEASRLRIIPSRSEPGRSIILYSDITNGILASFDEGEHFESIQEGMNANYAPYVFYHTPTDTVMTFTKSLRKAFVLQPDDRSWQVFPLEKPYAILPLQSSSR